MRAIIGIVLLLAGVVFGIWAGLWWALVGGICQIVAWAQADAGTAGELAWAIVKVLFAGAIGTVAAIVGVLPGYALIVSD